MDKDIRKLQDPHFFGSCYLLYLQYNKIINMVEQTNEEVVVMEPPSKYAFKRAASIVVPEQFFNPIRTGYKEVDDSWSEIGGVIPSQVTFITGTPGSGKTSLAIAIGAKLATSPKGNEEVVKAIFELMKSGTPIKSSDCYTVAFISLEMSEFQLAHQARKVPGFGHVNTSEGFDQVETMEYLRQMKPDLVILDSIQKAARKMRDKDGKQMAFNTAQYEIVNMFTSFAKETWTPMFLIGHCDKSGNYKGPSDLLHDVDSHLWVAYDKEMDVRTFGFGKNRFGGIVQESIFGITHDSIWIGSPFVKHTYAGAQITLSPTPLVKMPTAVPKAEVPPEDLMACLERLRSKWDGGTARALVVATMDWMKANDSDFNAGSIIGNVNKVKIDFRGRSVAHCHYNSGELVFGSKVFQKETFIVGKIGYRKEQTHIAARITNKADLLVWVLVHEWCHLYKDMQDHTQVFFDFVATKYDWLMGELVASVVVKVEE